MILHSLGREVFVRIHDERIPDDLFAEFTTRMPECCVEVVLEHNDAVLLARRTNEPVKGEWFWPGGRLYKGEELSAAADRIAREELNIAVEVHEQLGAYSHFWETSAVQGGESRHTVNIPFRVTPKNDDFEITLDDQHDDYRFVSELEPGLHEYVRLYLTDNNLLGD
jgi:colanic acid biosynthesis protein WcaH